MTQFMIDQAVTTIQVEENPPFYGRRVVPRE